MRVPLLFLIASTFLVQHVVGQGVAFEAALQDSVVVTALRHSADVRQTGRRVTVITAADLQQLPVASFDELIRFVGGVETQTRGGFGVQSDVTMRGSSFDGVVILLDGVRLHDPQSGHFLSNYPIPLSEIARVEVVRGPAALLYGPDAVGGVIQFFTWSGLSETDIAHPIAAEVTAGRYALYGVDAAARGQISEVVMSAATSWQGSDGQPVLDGTGQAIVGSDGEVRTDFRRHAHSITASGLMGRTALLARAGVDVRDFGSWHYYTPFESDTARSDSRTAWAQFRARTYNGESPLQMAIHGSARYQESSYRYNPVSDPNRHDNYTASVQGDLSYHASPRLNLAGGASAGIRGIDSNSMGRHHDASAGIYATASARPAPRLSLNAGARLDFDSGFGAQVTPQLNAAYSIDHITLRSGAGLAVRAPSYTERYYDTERPAPAGNLGNPDLRAERAWSYEGGADVYLSGVSLHVTAFQRRTTDLIDYARVDLDQPIFLAQNIASVVTRGLELDLESTRDFGLVKARYAGSYAWLNSDLSVPDGVDYKYALVHARHILQHNLYVYGRRAGLGVRALWKQPMSGEDFLVVDVRSSYRLTTRLSVSAEMRNVFNATYAEVFDAPMPQRWWTVGLTWR